MAADAHVHLSDLRFASDCGGVLERARDAGLSLLLLAGTEPADWARQRSLPAPPAGLSCALCFGVHPWWAADVAALDALAGVIEGAAAVGEIGLDHGPRGPDRAAQRFAFERQLAWARDHGKPVVLHVVRAHAEVLEALGRLPVPGGLVHGFAASAEIGRAYLARGLHLSVGAPAIAPGRQLARALDELPRSAWLIESDAPHGLAEPADSLRVAAALASRWGESPAQVGAGAAERLVALLRGRSSL